MELSKRIVRAEIIKKWIIDLNLINENEIEEALDSMWEIIERSIQETAMKHISKKKVYNTKSSKINRKSSRNNKV
ncbi:14073_t:CDS:1, partial [Gigaspora rosea]